MASMNEVNLIGNVGGEPVFHVGEGSRAVCRLSIATNEKHTTEDGRKIEHVEWHQVVAFGHLAEIWRKHVVKGALLLVRGALQTRKYLKDGVEKWTTEVIARDFQFLGAKMAPAATGGDAVPGAEDLL